MRLRKFPVIWEKIRVHETGTKRYASVLRVYPQGTDVALINHERTLLEEGR